MVRNPIPLVIAIQYFQYLNCLFTSILTNAEINCLTYTDVNLHFWIKVFYRNTFGNKIQISNKSRLLLNKPVIKTMDMSITYVWLNTIQTICLSDIFTSKSNRSTLSIMKILTSSKLTKPVEMTIYSVGSIDYRLS